MEPYYQASKISILGLIIFAVFEATFLLYGILSGDLIAALVMILCLTVLFLLFFSLSVAVYKEGLQISYGLGFFKSLIPLQEIQRTELITNSSILSVYDPKREHVLKVHLRSGGSRVVAVGDPKRMIELIASLNRGH